MLTPPLNFFARTATRGEGGRRLACDQSPLPHVMPPRKRKATDDDDDSATVHVQSSQSLAYASPLSPEETEKLANELCRYGACT